MRWSGLRARISAAVLLAVLLPSVVISTISYNRLVHSATRTLETTASDKATSDLFAASRAVQAAGPNGNYVAQPTLDTAFDATVGSRFDGVTVYAAAVLEPGPDGILRFTRTGPADSDTLHTTASPALVAATPFSDYVAYKTYGPLRLYLTADGHRWLSAGGGIDAVGFSDQPRDEIVLVEYHDLGPLDAQISSYRKDFVALIVVPMVFAGALAWLIAGLVQRPVRVAAEAAHRFGDGDRTVRLPVHGRDEMAELSSNFNTMADRLSTSLTTLEESEARQRQFVADVSHELRTPMTTLVAAADALDHPGTRAQAAALVGPQLRRLSRLTDDLIETSLLDSGTVEVDRYPVDLGELVRDVVAQSTDPAAFRFAVHGDVAVRGDARRLYTILRNLTANALVHGSAPVRITVLGDEEHVAVSVADEGPGVPSELGDRVFDRFVRADASRTRSDGSGLGLSLARDMAELHGGTLTVSTGPGAVFTLMLPR